MLYLHISKYLFAFFVAFVIAYVLTPLIRKWASSWGMMDAPGERRIHEKPIARGGGIAIFIAFHLGYLAIYFMGYETVTHSLNFDWWKGFALASSVLLLTGIIDDIIGVKPLLKLTGQIAAAGILIYFGAGITKMTGLDLPPIANIVVTLIWFLAITNAFNLIDGLDGLASGLGLISALGLVGFSLIRGLSMDSGVMLLLVGGCLAFLRYNFHPATIFLGDSGSMFIGFTLASFAVETSAKGSLAVTLALPLVAMGLPVFDTILAIYRRSLRRFFHRAFPERSKPAGVMDADKEHVHHRFLESGLKQHQVAIILYSINIFVVAVGVLSQFFRDQAVGILLVAFLAGVFVVVRHLARVELWDTGRAIVSGFRRPRGKVAAFIYYPINDFVSLSLSLWLALFVMHPADSLTPLRTIFLNAYAFWVPPVFIGLILCLVYHRVWSRSRFGDYLYLAIGIFAGTFAALAINFLMADNALVNSPRAVALIFGSTSLILIGGNRLFQRGVQDVMSLFRHGTRFNSDKDAEILILYGAGGRLALFLREKMLTMLDPGRARIIVGIVDDDSNLRGRLVNGFKVLGDRMELPRLLKKHAVDTVVVTMDIREEHLREVKAICDEAGVRLNVWVCHEQPVDQCLKEDYPAGKGLDNVVRFPPADQIELP